MSAASKFESLQNIFALRLTQNLTDKLTDKQTHIKNPDGQTDQEVL